MLTDRCTAEYNSSRNSISSRQSWRHKMAEKTLVFSPCLILRPRCHPRYLNQNLLNPRSDSLTCCVTAPSFLDRNKSFQERRNCLLNFSKEERRGGGVSFATSIYPINFPKTHEHRQGSTSRSGEDRCRCSNSRGGREVDLRRGVEASLGARIALLLGRMSGRRIGEKEHLAI